MCFASYSLRFFPDMCSANKPTHCCSNNCTTILLRALSTLCKNSSGMATTKPSTVVTKARSEEHTSELQSRPHLVCRLLLEKKKNTKEKSTRNTRRTKRQQRITQITS